MYCIYRCFNTQNYIYPFQNPSLGFILKISQISQISASIVYTQFGDAYKWLKFSRTMIDGKKPENSCSIYLNHSNTIHYDVVQDVCVNDLNQSDDIHSYSKRKEPIAKKTSQSTFHREQTQTKNMITKETAEKRKRKSQHSTITHSKKHKLVDDQVSCDLSNTSQNDDKMANMVNETKKNIHSTIPEIKKPKIKKTQSHFNNQNCSQTKTKSKIQKQKNVFSKLKNVQGNRKTDDKHKKVPMKSNEIDKLALKNMTTFHKSLVFGNIQEATLSLEDCILFPRSNDLHSSEACFPLTSFHSFLSFKVLVQRIQFSRFSNNAAYIMKQCLFLKSSLIA